MTTLKLRLYLLFVIFYATEIAAASSATPHQGAQESCYGKYLREHNMAILTAEDTDDSYEEQKKAVLVKQMYGDSYQLMVDTIEQRAVITKADGTYIADIHATLVDSTWYMWLSVDPLADKYPNNSPYMYCSGNPLKYVDPDGMTAIATSQAAQTRLLNTLSCTERIYVSFNTNGIIDINRLNQCESTSHNITALKALANSNINYNFYVQNHGINSNTNIKDAGGVTEMYGAENAPSVSPLEVNIISGDHLDGKAAAKNMAHEAFGHAYMYEKNKKAKNTAFLSSHHYEVDPEKSYIGEDGSWNLISIDRNIELQQHITEAVNEAIVNYNCKDL